MTPTERQILRKLYNEACHGAGAQVRRSARASLEAMLAEAGVAMLEAFEDNGLCIAAYFASRPI
jgi:hypothetical protein